MADVDKGLSVTVLPAYAGMIPVTDAHWSAWSSAPRVCGDDPVAWYLRRRVAGCSPRMRG